eukprot:1187061-Prorocentrum_minimum.AAC.1
MYAEINNQVFDVHQTTKSVLNEKEDWVDLLLYVVPKDLHGSDILKIFGYVRSEPPTSLTVRSETSYSMVTAL